jgi:hypothetical protein
VLGRETGRFGLSKAMPQLQSPAERISRQGPRPVGFFYLSETSFSIRNRLARRVGVDEGEN